MKRRFFSKLLPTMAAALLMSAPAMAVPTSTAYVGTLKGANGLPINGPVDVQIALFTAQTGGSSIYAEDIGLTDVNSGRMNVQMGIADPSAYINALMSSNTVWIEFTIDGEVLTPRQAVVSVPYALLAYDSERLGGNEASDFLQQGNVNIEGSVSINGTQVINSSGMWVGGGMNSGGIGPKTATNPHMAMGVQSPVCTSNSSLAVDWIRYGINFPQTPIFASTIDESLDDSGATWCRLEKSLLTNRLGIRCDGQSDSLHWMAIQPGVHTISGKKVIAGRFTKSGADVVTSDTVFFPQLFNAPPVVLIFPDVSPDSSGGTIVRIIGNVTTGGFQVYADSGIDALHWIAMDAGEYNHGNLHWYAGIHATNNTCTNPCTLIYPVSFNGPPAAVLTIHDINNSGASWVRHRTISDTALIYRMNSSTENVHYVLFDTL
ncbi:MAG: hypothetical protein HUU55_11195 [Myxococcales bacterium]|nr:hypothetical protein [Myxococcales bacterium]